jgi:perosamine synthetase
LILSRIYKDPSLSIWQLLRGFYPLRSLNDQESDLQWGESAGLCLWQWLRMQEVPANANVCFPAYICDSVTSAFADRGIAVRFYAVHRQTLLPDMVSLDAVTDVNTWAWLGVNYFGFPTVPQHFIETGLRRGIIVIEDNAHGWQSREGGRLLGFRADVGLFSPRKTFPLPDGGALLDLRNSDSANDPCRPPAETIRWRYLLKRLIWNIEESSRFPLYTLFKIVRSLFKVGGQSFVGISGGSENQQNLWDWRPMSRISRSILATLDMESVVSLRRRNYSFWLESFKRIKKGCGDFSPLFPELEEGICPFVFPVVVADPQQFKAGCSALGLETVPWPGIANLPPNVPRDGDVGNAFYLASHIWALPVHQTLNLSTLQKRLSRYCNLNRKNYVLSF